MKDAREVASAIIVFAAQNSIDPTMLKTAANTIAHTPYADLDRLMEVAR